MRGGGLLPPESSDAEVGVELDSDDLPDPPNGGYDGNDVREDDRDGPPSREAVYDVPVKMQAVLGRAKMPIAELVAMHSGEVFELDRQWATIVANASSFAWDGKSSTGEQLPFGSYRLSLTCATPAAPPSPQLSKESGQSRAFRYATMR